MCSSHPYIESLPTLWYMYLIYQSCDSHKYTLYVVWYCVACAIIFYLIILLGELCSCGWFCVDHVSW